MNEISNEIIFQASEGDVQAFELIYKEFFKFVTNVAFRIVTSIDDAEEITQEVFINIFRNLKKFRFDSTFKTWIYRITINTSINYSKKMSKHRKKSVEYNDAFNISDVSEGIREKIDNTENEKVIANLLDQLNSEQKTCIILRSLEGLSYQEISETLNVPINTVRSRIKRGREAMLALRKEVVKDEM